jgi:hypothetical protein
MKSKQKTEREIIASEALEDFKKHKKSVKCRYYINIIQSLRCIPYGVGKPRSNIVEFYQFIPSKERVGISKEKATEMVLVFYAAYSDLKQDQEYKKLISRLRYQKNKEKIKQYNKERYHKNKEYREKKLEQMRESWQKEKEFRKFLYCENRKEYRIKNKEKLTEYSKKWRKENRQKHKEYQIRYMSKKRISNMQERGLTV